MLPFTHDQFLNLFGDYNASIWPVQAIAYALAIAICMLLWRKSANRGAWVGGGLSLFWLWTGVVYHAVFFSRINGLAIAFGMVFVLEGLLLAFAGITGRLSFGDGTRRPSWRAILAWALVLYSAIAYPIIGAVNGVTYPNAPSFGVTPCPVTLFTWGILLMARTVPLWLVVVPFAWALVGGSAAFLLGVPQDWPLLASVAIAFLVPRSTRSAHHVA